MFTLGEGKYGIVVYPNVSNEPDKVSKFSFKDDIIKEFKNIKLLPNNGYFIDSDDVSISKNIPKKYEKYLYKFEEYRKLFFDNIEEIKKYHKDKLETEKLKYLKKFFGDRLEFNIFEMSMPYIKGFPLKVIFDTNDSMIYKQRLDKIFLCINNNMKDSKFVDCLLPNNVSIRMFKSYIKMCLEIKKMNDSLIFHNDIHYENIIYDIINDKYTIIDYQFVTVGERHVYISNGEESISYDLVNLKYYISYFVSQIIFIKNEIIDKIINLCLNLRISGERIDLFPKEISDEDLVEIDTLLENINENDFDIYDYSMCYDYKNEIRKLGNRQPFLFLINKLKTLKPNDGTINQNIKITENNGLYTNISYAPFELEPYDDNENIKTLHLNFELSIEEFKDFLVKFLPKMKGFNYINFHQSFDDYCYVSLNSIEYSTDFKKFNDKVEDIRSDTRNLKIKLR